MIRSALGIVVTLLAFLVATPDVHAKAKKQSTSRTAAKPAAKAPVKRKTSVVRRQQAKESVKLGRVRNISKKSVVHARAHVHAAAPVRKVAFAPVPAPVSVPPVMTAGDLAGLNLTHDPLALKSNVAFVIDQTSSQVLLEKNAGIALPIASLTKLMTAVVVVEAHQNMDEVLEVTSDDIDRERHSASRLRVGAQLSRADMLHIALMSSENRAASALGRNYPGGLPAFVAAMNAKAKALGMTQTHYVDSTGLSSQNVASARDLAKLVVAAHRYPMIRNYSTYPRYAVDVGRGQLNYMNSNRLVLSPDWDIGLQKTGYITEAGRCLVMQARIDGRPVVMVFLDSKGKDSRLADAGRVRKWLQTSKPQQILTQAAATQS
jgi:D-alanyl-D-alanine endopeptidase (penicillin-binding protein 7)